MSARDPYLQPNGVLRNKLGIQDGYELLAYEKDFVVTRYIGLKKQRECPDAKRAAGLHPKIRTVNKNPSCCRMRTTTGGIRYAKTIYKN